MATYIQYVRRGLKIGDIGKDEDLAWDGPVGHATDKHLTERYAPKPDDVIYLVSVLEGESWPSLDARVVVTQDEALYPERVRALQRARKRVFAAGPGSCWFPMLDARRLLAGLRGSRGRDTSRLLGVAVDARGRRLHYGQRLQGARSPRRLAPASARALERWVAAKVRDPVFISYRTADGTDLARLAASWLARHGIPVWYDKWSISIRLDEIDRTNAEAQLDRNIQRAMRSCAAVVKIDTLEYGKSDWTEKEERWLSGCPWVSLPSGRPDLERLVEDVQALRG